MKRGDIPTGTVPDVEKRLESPGRNKCPKPQKKSKKKIRQRGAVSWCSDRAMTGHFALLVTKLLKRQ